MTDQERGSQGSEPLFRNMDEQERIYAPQQVPGGVNVDEEVDAGGTAGSGTAATARERGGSAIAGAEGDQRTTPVVPVRPDLSANVPIEVPATPDDRRLGEERGDPPQR